MAVLDGVGYNKHSTPYKQFALNGASGHLVGTSAEVAKMRNAPGFICDMTAGPGMDPDGREGSPLILAKHISAQLARGRSLTLVCVDWNEDHLDTLHALMEQRYPGLPVRYFRDQASALASIPPRAVGLTYWDTTRYNDLDVDLLKSFGRSHRAMDILITRECLAGYRMQRAPHCVGTLTIQDYLALTGKRCNYIMQYADWGWWSFGFADNWVDRPPRKLRGFYDVLSQEGRRRFSKFDADPSVERIPTERLMRQEDLPWGA